MAYGNIEHQAITWTSVDLPSLKSCDICFMALSQEILKACFQKLIIEMRARSPRKEYRQVSNIRRTLVGNKIVDQADVVGASPVGAAPTTPSFLT